MNSLSDVEGNLPPGFRFHPRDEELVCDYLMNWVSGVGNYSPMITKVEINKCEPWEIPETACVGGKEWYFYCLRDRKYATGLRTNRATMSGYWKATGKDRPISRKGIQVGMRKTLVFYQGRAPKGRKTGWVMHEFRVEDGSLDQGMRPAESSDKEDWVVCRVFKKHSDISGKQEAPSTATGNSMPPPSSLMDNYTAFDHHMVTSERIEQVPCFSIITPSQSNPCFSLFTTQKPVMPDFNVYMSSSSSMFSSEDPSHCNKWEIKAVAKRETSLHVNGTYESGEGSCDSYLSEANLSSMWNKY